MARAAIGVDLGGSHVMAAAIDEGGEIHAKFERDIDDRAPAAVVDALASVVKSAIDADRRARHQGFADGDGAGVGGATPGGGSTALDGSFHLSYVTRSGTGTACSTTVHVRGR